MQDANNMKEQEQRIITLQFQLAQANAARVGEQEKTITTLRSQLARANARVSELLPPTTGEHNVSTFRR